MAVGDTFICPCCQCEMQIQFDGAVQREATAGALEKYDKHPRPPGWEPIRAHDVREDFSGRIRRLKN